MSFHARADAEADLSADLNGMLSLTCDLPKYAFRPVQDHNHQLSTLSQRSCTGLPALEQVCFCASGKLASFRFREISSARIQRNAFVLLM